MNCDQCGKKFAALRSKEVGGIQCKLCALCFYEEDLCKAAEVRTQIMKIEAVEALKS